MAQRCRPGLWGIRVARPGPSLLGSLRTGGLAALEDGWSERAGKKRWWWSRTVCGLRCDTQGSLGPQAEGGGGDGCRWRFKMLYQQCSTGMTAELVADRMDGTGTTGGICQFSSLQGRRCRRERCLAANRYWLSSVSVWTLSFPSRRLRRAWAGGRGHKRAAIRRERF